MATGTKLQLRRLTGSIGAEVVGVNVAQLDDATFEGVHRAFLDHCVLLFRKQTADAAQQLAFTRRWGTDHLYEADRSVPGFPEVIAITNPGKAKVGTEQWHSDIPYIPVPPAHAILSARILPPAGGDTMWASQHAAYEALSAPFRAMIDGLRAVNRKPWKRGMGDPDSLPSTVHPLVRTHAETGRKSLFLNRSSTVRIDGWTEKESAGLLGFLIEHSTSHEFVYRHVWEPGDIVMWDNRCTLHYAVHDHGDHERVMWRTSCAGEVPR